jgi:Protein phosphatase 2C
MGGPLRVENYMWRFAAARAIGSSHLKANIPCQDYFACMALQGGAFVAAVADGAGSAAMAEHGAKIAVDAVTTYLKESLEENRTAFDLLLREAAAAARNSVIDEAHRQGAEPRSYASTLLAVVLTSKGGGALQIGDGVIVVSDDDEGWSWMFWPQRGEYTNTTHFLTDENAIDHIETTVFRGSIKDVALMSDGLESLALHYASKTVYNPFFTGMFQHLQNAEGSAEIGQLSALLESFLSSDQVRSRTDDDTSLILATRRDSDKSS